MDKTLNRLILLRHGQSEWNKKNIFTGWVDIPLSEKGIAEAMEAGQQIKEIPIDRIYTSTLIRGTMTAMLAMAGHGSGKIPVILHPEGKLAEWGKCFEPETEAELIPVTCAWELNERMYGELQGRNKQETREKFGAEQVKIWRRSFSTPPPGGESLEMTAARTIPYFESEIVPKLAAGQNVLISAHGNSLRSIVMDLDQLTEDEVLNLEIPTGKPIIYTYKQGKLSRTSHEN